MKHSAPFPLPLTRSLSANLLLFTIVFVMLSEVLIYVPSIARYRLTFLEQRVAEAHLATLALDAAPAKRLEPALEQVLLSHVGVLAVELWRPQAELMLGRMPSVDARFDLRGSGVWPLIRDAFQVLANHGERVVSVVLSSRLDPQVQVQIFLDERALYAGMYEYSWRILQLSVVISLITAGLVYFSLQMLMVRPMRRLAANLAAFGAAPENHRHVLRPGRRADEIGVLQRQLARMQAEVRESLAQKTRLAALGTAMSKITHDLRGILNTAELFAERLKRIEDPAAQQVTPLLVNSLDRAVQLCTQTLDLARGEQAVPQRSRFPLAGLLQEVGAALGLGAEGSVRWRLDLPPDLEVNADYDRLFRVFMNLGRNAVRALDGSGEIMVSARRQDGTMRIEFGDSGRGIPPEVRGRLFQPFAGSATGGGIGLGLATARDLMRAHGGDLSLLRSGPQGTVFELELPGD